MRFSIFGITSVSLLILPVFALAQTDSTSTASTTESGGFFETIIENVTNITSPAPAAEENNSVLDATTEKRLTNLAANISNRLDGLNARLRQIAGRLDKRIQLQASSGYNVDAARASLTKAYEKLDVASRELNDIDRAVYRAFRSQDPKSEWQEVRRTYITTRDTIREAHVELKNTVMHLKSAAPVSTVASSTATST